MHGNFPSESCPPSCSTRRRQSETINDASGSSRHARERAIRAARAHRVRIRVTQRVECDFNSHFARLRRRDDDVDDSQRLARRERHRRLARDRLARARHALARRSMTTREREGDIFRDDDSTTTARETTRRRDGRRAELQASVRYGLALARGATYCVDC